MRSCWRFRVSLQEVERERNGLDRWKVELWCRSEEKWRVLLHARFIYLLISRTFSHSG